jgi:hypothetical protein
MRRLVVVFALMSLPGISVAQVQGKFPPDSLVNVKVFPKNTPVQEVVGAMRTFSMSLGVRCHFCHVGEEGMPLPRMDFASDEKREKLVARQMMLMVQEVNRRLDTLPTGTSQGALRVTCHTCHRGVTRPIPLATLIADVARTAGADSATRAYRALRTQHYGRDAYDFGEQSLSTAALQLARARKFDEALAVLKLNEEVFPTSSGAQVVRGNVHVLRGDTTAAETAFREALRRDSTNNEARGRLRAIGRQP